MKITLSILPLALLTTSLAAQGGLTTATGYAVYARIGNISTPGNVQGVPAGTDITRSGLQIRADASASTGAIPAAMASTHARLSRLSTSVDSGTVLVDERGYAIPGAGRPAVAGTSDNPRTGGQASHGLDWVVPARPGTTAIVAVTWTAGASIGAFQTAAVDVDGDGTPEFAQRITNSNVQISRTYRVRAGNNGFTLGITTEAGAGANVSVSTATGSRYDGRLSVSLRIQPRCAFTNFGRECAGRLDGVVPGPNRPAFTLNLTGAQPRVPAILVVGNRLRTPIPLPGSRCDLYVSPMVAVAGQTDAQGEESWSFPALSTTPSLIASFQAVTVDLAGNPIFGSSNGTTVACQ